VSVVGANGVVNDSVHLPVGTGNGEPSSKLLTNGFDASGQESAEKKEVKDKRALCVSLVTLIFSIPALIGA